MKRKLIAFDLDGTLLPGTTASLEIARATGTTAQLVDLERAFSAGQCTTHEFAHAVARLWSDVSVTAIAKAFSDTPKIGNIEPTEFIDPANLFGWLDPERGHYFQKRSFSVGPEKASPGPPGQSR